MKRFLILVVLFLVVPLLVVTGVYFLTDPYRTLKPFKVENSTKINRDYVSSALFLNNIDTQHYDSYIFCSSRGTAFNTYHWRQFLPEGSKPFLFQAWMETLNGYVQKVDYIDSHGYPIKNAILLFDVRGTFFNDSDFLATRLKHPVFSNRPVWCFQAVLLFDFLQKPSEWIRAVCGLFSPYDNALSIDPISNDWQSSFFDFSCPPPLDSLSEMDPKLRMKAIEKLNSSSERMVKKDVIDERSLLQLNHLQEVFTRQGTDCRIIISPDLKHPGISDRDLQLLYDIFGEENVYDFSNDKNLTEDYALYRDTGHFGYYLGWYILRQVYASPQS